MQVFTYETHMCAIVEILHVNKIAQRITLIQHYPLIVSGMNQQERDMIERLFLNGDLTVLVCTTTLAVGVGH
jgi:superfamily II helicase